MHRLPRAFALRNSYPYIPRRRPVFHTPRTQQRWRSQTTHSSNGDPMRYQTVRFKRPGISFRRILTFGVYTGIVYGYLAFLWRQMDIEVEFVEDDEAGQAQEQEEEAEEEMEEEDEGPLYADEDSTFIPLTWGKKMPRTFYRGSDPEWQEFIRISKDEERRKGIQVELANIVQAGSAQHPSISRHVGGNTKVGHYWLDISFPDGPPQHYERQGIEIGDGFIAWSTQKVDADQQWRTERALVPRAAAEGVWSTAKVLLGIQWRRVKQQLGLEGINPSSPEERVRALIQQKEEQQRSKQGGGTQMDSGTNVVASSPAAQPARPNAPAEKKSDLPWHIPNVPLPSSAATSSSTSVDLPIAMHVFSSTISKSWNPKKMEAPRGAVIVQGMVEVRGSHGRMLIDVQSCYDPRANKFTHINAGVRSYKRWKQGPRGGP